MFILRWTGHLLLALGIVFGASTALGQKDKGARTKGSKVIIHFQPSSLVAEAVAALNDGDAEKALALTTEAMAKDLAPSDQEIALNNLCVAYAMKQDYPRAILNCDKLVRRAPAFWVYYNNRANAYLQSGQIKRAITDYERAVELAEALEAGAEAQPLGDDGAMKVSEILSENLRLAQERQALDLEGVAVGEDEPES